MMLLNQIAIMFLFGTTLTPDQETFNFIVVLLGIILLIIILAYILLTSRED
ncbi:MAG: hypothetical protein ACFFD5_15210 [Candidatus Thorarchaeota archaeon]